ncbi:LutC/YkgG family protein [Saliterribacillus persicus]|uniref:Lactate utilization protein C n=1 Tax=Saliterribacillus persicus TaxID=930114 RepID=A0A368X7F3_9BACI|nr:lactate utilization protein C [Saliterribacillus persicus]RCW63745.1 L-lactate dehydrogenase complex protein LldG [Saliterribacillus persicus]
MEAGQIHNKDAFLSKVRNHLGVIEVKDHVEKPEWSVSPQKNVLKGKSKDELVEVLKEQCKVIHTDFYQTKKNELNGVLESIIKKFQATSVVSWSDEEMKKYLNGIDAIIKNNNIDFSEWDDSNPEESIKNAEKADIGITYSDITLAESGTVVLFNSLGKGRSISLLPKFYVALIPKSSIVPRMTQATTKIDQEIEAGNLIPSCVNFITGPSNSADIEMNLVVGVHGPIKAAYIVLDDI